MIFQHPLSYLLGLEGIALLRAMSGDYDEAFTLDRFADVKRLLESSLGSGGSAEALTSAEVYRTWAPFYDQPGNQLIDLEQPLVQSLLADLPVGVALDAACGTGRHSQFLSSLGHEVIGLDSSKQMLAIARRKVPSGRFHEAELTSLPIADNSVDLVVCALALSHVPDLVPVLGEFVRVLRPGGSLVISETRGLIGSIGLPIVRPAAQGFGYLPNKVWLTSDHLAAALPLGLQLRHCAEPRRPAPLVDDVGVPPGAGGPVPTLVADGPPDIWALHAWAVEATNAAYRDTPLMLILRYELPA